MVTSILEPDFAATFRDGSSPEVSLTGNADNDCAAKLGELLLEVHDLLTASHARSVASGEVVTVVIDMTGLEFMCASAFNALTTWLVAVSEAADDARYHVAFRTNPKIPWQQRSLRTLSCFATDRIRVVAP